MTPVRHRLSYRVWFLLIDLDELRELDRNVGGFTDDGPGAVSFHVRDHGPRDGSPLRPWIERLLDRADIELEGGAIRILCMPRILGYVFNPISVWFCHHVDGSVRALLYEVSNTFGEHHAYLVPLEEPAWPGQTVRSSFDKELFVSPFIDMAARYAFATVIPAERATMTVREVVASRRVLDAALITRRSPLTTASLARAFFGTPLLTLKVIGGIHWEAIKLRYKGAPYRRRGAPPANPVSIVADRSVTEERSSR